MKTYGPAKVTNCNVASLSGSDNMERIDFPGRNIFRPRSFIIVVGNDNVGIGGCGGGEWRVVVEDVVASMTRELVSLISL